MNLFYVHYIPIPRASTFNYLKLQGNIPYYVQMWYIAYYIHNFLVTKCFLQIYKHFFSFSLSNASKFSLENCDFSYEHFCNKICACNFNYISISTLMKFNQQQQQTKKFSSYTFILSFNIIKMGLFINNK